MMAYVSKKCSLGIVYLSPMHISERTIVGYNLPDTHEDLVTLTKPQRDQYRKEKLDTSKLVVAMYIYGAMKKIKGNGCILAATTSSKSETCLEHIYVATG
jgi:hypothetical protein